MKLFGKPIENLFKSRTEVVKEGLAKPILTIRDLEDAYKEFADHEDKYTGDFNDFVDLETQAEYKYWDGAGDPESRGRGMTDYERAANIAADEDMDMAAIDDIDLRDILGKTGWVEGPEVDDSPEPVIENKNPHTAPEDLPVEVEPAMVQPERVKPQVKVELEKTVKPMTELEKFKLMKNVVGYEILVAKNPNLEKLRPMRGDMPLSLDEIKTSMKAFRAKKEMGTEEISQEEQDFFNHCQAWVGVALKVEAYKGNEPKGADGHLLSSKERDLIQEEYFTLKGNAEKFAQLSALLDLEEVGNKKVESGEWKKSEFAWKEEKGQKGSRWYAMKGMDQYITYGDVKSVLGENSSAEFFYTIPKQEPMGKGTRFFISIKTPEKKAVLV